VSDEVADVPERWPVESSEDLYRSELPFALRAHGVRGPRADEEPFTRVVLEHPGAVVVLALDEEDRALCLRQYRHPVGLRMVELPAGLMDRGDEEPEDVARRELAEEAGLRAGSWTHLTSAYSSPGITGECIHYFLARDLSPAGRSDLAGFEAQHEEADMTTEWVPFRRLFDAVRFHDVQDAPLVISVLTAAALGLVSPDGSKD
jgi:8-oxo-dGTP pyrophosphatase MutT (NUDIX family)